MEGSSYSGAKKHSVQALAFDKTHVLLTKGVGRSDTIIQINCCFHSLLLFDLVDRMHIPFDKWIGALRKGCS